MMSVKSTGLGMAFLAVAAASPALAWDNDWRDRQRVSPREVERSWNRVQDERRDLARAQRRGDWDDVRRESRQLRRAEREFREDREDLRRARWNGGWNGGGTWNAGWDGGPPPHARGWGRGGRPANDLAWRADGWRQPGWHAEHFYRQGNYRPVALGWNDPVWRGYDNRYYCRRSDGTTGLIVGGLAGGVLGNVLAPGGSKTIGSLIGGVAGAVIGSSVDRGRVICR